ncbi:uncharacterized protein LOC129567288 [Sitodiplosis mosellana]|uniref:uncharacterized protein LOC129567288 n=1 Tax=Sitodiplosis mosellana TaxID=263140 RepID=UPI0024438810|nr:uncharacterized protein LOC129567288 [Sitodiplosis mosellana]
MNAQYLVLILLNCWLLSKYITTTVAISQVKPNLLKAGETHVRRLQPSARNYLYLNYKEAYGLRFDPKKTHKKRQSNVSSDDQPTWNDVSVSMPTPPPAVSVTTMEANGMQTVSVSTEIASNLTTTIASPASSDVSITTSSTMMKTTSTQSTTTDDKVSSTEGTRPNKQPVIAFSSLLNWNNAAKRKNATTMIQRPNASSSLKETLQLIRKRIKQWLAHGSDTKASLVNGQRFLNLFNVIKFENGPCTSTQEGLTEMSGICYQDFQCTEMGGSSIDECADGLGVCCVFKTGCGQTTNQLDSYFQNPGWPEASQDRLICTLTIELQENVQQVRLDMILLELKAPTDGNCIDDQFYVAGQNLNNMVPTICGVNSGQHMYIEVSNSMDRKVFLTILTSSVATRAFNIRVQQLQDSLAPNNCLQYYTETDGWFQTFNYDDTSQFVTNRVPSYFNNLNYVICIQRQWNYCSTTYSNEADDMEYDFQLINIDSEGMSVIPEKQAGVEIFSCNDDYISVNSIRLCGEKLNDANRNDDLTANAVITDTSNGLNIIPVRTNDAGVGRGFRINYIQQLCEDQSVTMEPTIETTEAPPDDSPISKYKRNQRT